MAEMKRQVAATKRLCASLAVLLVAGVMEATTGAVEVGAQRAPVFLEPSHWSDEALRRFASMGLLPGAADPVLAPLTVQHVRHALGHAAEEAERSGNAQLRDLARAYLSLLDAETDSDGSVAALRTTAGWFRAVGEARAGDGYIRDEDWQGAQRLTVADGPAVLVQGSGHLSHWLSWSAVAGRVEDMWTVPSATLAATAGPFDVWAGRRRLHYGAGRSGATAIGSGTHASDAFAQRTLYSFDGVGIHVREPFHFPGFLKILGPARIEATGGRLTRNGNVEDPFVVFGRLIGHPFSPRLTLGINRGAIFGGEGNPITVGRMMGLLVGVHGGEGGEFENQVFSTIVKYRPPLGAWPFEFYIDWGMDDTAGAFKDAPGVVAGVDLAAVPGLPAVGLGIERTSFPEACCGNPIWYRSVFFRGSWADEGRLFAHPIGGHGTEWLAHAAVDLPRQGLLLRARAMTRERGEENLFAPGREGRSHGAAGSLEYRLRPGSTLLLNGSFEAGGSWNTHRLAAMISHSLRRRVQ